MNPMIERALKLVEKGYTPLLLHGKAPIAGGWQNMSVTKADVENWNVNGHNIGLRTGDKGLIVLDFDGLSGYEAFCNGFPELVDTHTVKTGSGNGMHVYLSLQGELPRSSGQLTMPDGGYIEIKAKGRQVVIPPSVHPDTNLPYQVHVASPIKVITTFAPIQEWIDVFNPKPEYQPRPEPAPAALGEHAAYAKQALSNMAAELSRLTNVKDDPQNDMLNEMAWKLAHFVRRGDLTESECRNALLGAMQSNGYVTEFGSKAAEKTFESGFNRGYGDTSFEPEVYRRPSRSQTSQNWNEQKRPDREMPGAWQAYTPPAKAVTENGITVVGRTRIIKRTSLLSDLSDRIADEDYKPEAPPIIFPLTCLHKLGGQARVTKPGKIIIFAGSSGSGKTSALETIADLYVSSEIPVPVWLWSPEWTPDELAERAVQRHGGVTQDDLYLHEINQWRINDLGQPSNPYHELNDEVRKNSSEAMRTLRSWKQDVYFVENSLLSIDEMAEVIAAAKGLVDPFPRVFIVDYAQLLKANDVEDKDDAGMYGMVQRFKAICVRYGLVGILATQATKSDARQNIKDGKFKGTTVINCTKNSRGIKGKIRVMSDPDRLRILDQAHPVQTFADDDYFLGSQSGRWMNDDAANLWLTLNPEYE